MVLSLAVGRGDCAPTCGVTYSRPHNDNVAIDIQALPPVATSTSFTPGVTFRNTIQGREPQGAPPGSTARSGTWQLLELHSGWNLSRSVSH